jgi:hypothetical protein
MIRNKHVVLILGSIILVAAVRVGFTYRLTAPGFDETCHVAAAVELVDHHTYTLDPVHPPLSRLAMGIPLYLAGARFPELPPNTPGMDDYNVVGNHILYDDGHFFPKLVVARAVMLPFLALLTLLVFLWARREFGTVAGLVSPALFTTLPMVLAFSSLAYSDIPAATAQFAALFAICDWLEKPLSWRGTLLFSVVVSAAFLTKFTSILYLFFGGGGMLLCKWIITRKLHAATSERTPWLKHLSVAALTTLVLVWLGYGFSVGHIREAMQLSVNNMPSFQHFPGPVRGFARAMVIEDPLVPAPALLHGLSNVWVLNKSGTQSYLFGKVKTGGWWYFFPAGLMFKSPLPFLLLCLIAVVPLLQSAREAQWTRLAPAAAVLAILVSTMPVSYKAGIRHVLIVFPLLAMLAALGGVYLWQLQGKAKLWGRVLLFALLAWQSVSTIRAQQDFIAYFNEFAGSDPSKILVQGCDLDCGQDVFRLASYLHTKQVSTVHLALWSSADMSQMGLPSFDVLQPFHPVSGWVAVSLRSLRVGHIFHTAYPPGALAWLDDYQPVDHIGKTIWLYYIPEDRAEPGRDKQ